jgi:predicted dehydrogenase/threonine dehydrogenase-like Zn-dependent dehydrogenase
VVLRGGRAQVVEVPAPSPGAGRVLVANAASVISSGTERAALASSGGSLPQRAIRNPQLVKAALGFARDQGVRKTLERVRETAQADLPLGYSTAGIAIDTGGVPDLRVGQRVACGGAGLANHADVVSVPANLVVPVPDGLPLTEAAFATIGAIALQGVRRTEPTLGERVVVSGLGLLGLLTVQLLRAAGCPVLGIEPAEDRRALGAELGAELAVAPGEAEEAVARWTGGTGADAVVVTAAGESDEILNAAVRMVRRKGRVVPVGAVGLGLERQPLYLREADVLISTSYGPGRYDPTYEEQGIDYPLPYVRWTEGRNMEEFLRLVGAGAVRLGPLVGTTVPVDDAPDAYAAVNGESPPLAAVLTYADEAGLAAGPPAREVVRVSRARGGAPAGGELTLALVGAGQFLRGTHLPTIKAAAGVRVKTVVARRGTAALEVARSVGGADAATDWREAVEDPEVDLLVVTTRHDSHAEIAAAGLRAGRSVFVEKPLGLTREEIDDVWDAGRENDRLAIGFNRPFAPLARALGEEVGSASGPIQLVYRVNAPLPADNWLRDPVEGGGPLLGEACHMLDFANWLCGVPERVAAAALPVEAPTVDSASITVAYAGGSVATVHYGTQGSSAMPKERVEVMRGGRSWVLDDFRRLESYAAGGGRSDRTGKLDKGWSALLEGVLAAARGERPFEPGLGSAYLAQSVALAALESIASGGPVEVVSPARAPAQPARTG